jgi:DNA-binding MarR family transcriptional regulator
VTDRSDPPIVALDDMVCFNLHGAFRAVTAVYRPLLEPLGVSYPQYLVLALLWEHGDLPVGSLVSRLQSDYGTITPLVKRLEKQGLVSRTRNPDDERSVTVSLTPEGDALRVHAPRIYQAITETFGFTRERADAALEVLRSINAHASRKATTQD